MFVSLDKTRNKAVFSSVILLTALVVTIVLGGLRYSYGKNGHGVLDTFSQQQLHIAKSKESGKIYLSTIGDIGVSVYQAVDARESMRRVSGLSLLDMAANYSKRLLPEFLVQNRPLDVYAVMGFNFGGGALHAFGEGYFFSGLLGVICVGFVFGLFTSISYLYRELYIVTNDPLCWLVYIAPWILVIRGGWYQFFAIFKGIEILLMLFGALLLIRLLERRRNCAIRIGDHAPCRYLPEHP